MTYAWIKTDDGREIFRRVRTDRVARSDLPCPMLSSDHIEPVRSMVDGRMYDSKAALRATYKPSGNVNGERYLEVGNEQQTIPKPKKPDRAEIRFAARKALSQVGIST